MSFPIDYDLRVNDQGATVALQAAREHFERLRGVTFQTAEEFRRYQQEIRGTIQGQRLLTQEFRVSHETFIATANVLRDVGSVGREVTHITTAITSAQTAQNTATLALNEAIAKHGVNSHEAARAQHELAKANEAMNAAMAGSALQAVGLVGHLGTMIPHMRMLGLSISGAAVEFGVLRAAIVATGIGAIVVVLATVTNGFQDWTLVLKGVGFVLLGLSQPIQLLLRAIGFFVPEARKAADEIGNFSKSLIEGTFKMPEFTASAQTVTGSLDAAHNAAMKASGGVENFGGSISRAKEALEQFRDANLRMKGALITPGGVPSAALGEDVFFQRRSRGGLLGAQDFLGVETIKGINSAAELAIRQRREAEAHANEEARKANDENIRQLDTLRDVYVNRFTEAQLPVKETARVLEQQLAHKAFGEAQRTISDFGKQWGLTWTEAEAVLTRSIENMRNQYGAFADDIMGKGGFPRGRGGSMGDLINQIQAGRIAAGQPTLTTGELISRGFLTSSGQLPGFETQGVPSLGGRGETHIHVHSNLHLDGKKIADHVSHHLAKARQNVASSPLS